jgi:RNA polymerase sigma factor (sigma-70 family)
MWSKGNQSVNTTNALRAENRKQQQASLQAREDDLRRTVAEKKKVEFFQQSTPLLDSLKSYIKRRLRVAYLEQQIQTPVYTTGDILDQVLLRAYTNYEHKPSNLTLEQWFYRIANEVLENYLHRQASRDARRRSLEDLTQAELRTLEESITADAEGEVMLPEDLDDSELPEQDFTPPVSNETPEQELEKKERVLQILSALSRVPERDRIVFELFAIEGFSKEEVARIMEISPEEVERTVRTVRTGVLQELRSDRTVPVTAQLDRKVS